MGREILCKIHFYSESADNGFLASKPNWGVLVTVCLNKDIEPKFERTNTKEVGEDIRLNLDQIMPFNSLNGTLTDLLLAYSIKEGITINTRLVIDKIFSSLLKEFWFVEYLRVALTPISDIA